MMRLRLARRAQDGADPLAVLRMAMRDHEARIAELDRRVAGLQDIMQAQLAAAIADAHERGGAGHPILDLAAED